MSDENIFTCPDCDHEETEEHLYKRYDRQDGKIEFKCEECHSRIGIEFHCSDCDEWYKGRIQLKPYDNGTVCDYVCPECDGLIRKGNVLDKKQGPFR
jgi:uncharacterized protein YlaI